jgi:RNA polymerase sigma-70 factor (ECF subfamily)
MSALLRAFHQAAATGPAGGTTYDTAELAGSLGALYARGRRAHPRLPVSEVAFGRFLARCANDTAVRSLDALVAEDVYLACACAEGVRGAAAVFEAEQAKVIRKAVSRVLEARNDREDAEQRVRQHLLVGGDAGPAIAKYSGHVPLAKWVGVVAIRIAISLNRSENAERRLREKAGAEAIGVSPEDLYMKAELRQTLEPAVAEALGRLAERDRLILRLYLVGGMTLHAIARSLGLSQPAVSKRLAKARDVLLEDIRDTVATRLKVPKDELSSVMRFIVSQLDVNISRVLRPR